MCSRLGNSSEDQQAEPQHVIESAPKVVPVAEQITVVGVQAMIRAILAKKVEKTKKMPKRIGEKSLYRLLN